MKQVRLSTFIISFVKHSKTKIMKSFFAVLFVFVVSTVSGQVIASKTVSPDPDKKVQVVEVSCGKCKLGLPGKTCDMAVRIDDKAYYVDGASIDDFGDAHAHNGFCNAIRKAEVQGEVVEKRFKLTYIKLLPDVKNK